jgi:hypothetical protein
MGTWGLANSSKNYNGKRRKMYYVTPKNTLKRFGSNPVTRTKTTKVYRIVYRRFVPVFAFAKSKKTGKVLETDDYTFAKGVANKINDSMKNKWKAPRYYSWATSRY